MHPIVRHPVVTKLAELFENADFSTQLGSALASFGQHNGVCVRIDAVICASNSITSNAAEDGDKSLSLV
jgi:hypothetical protein